MKNYGIMLGKHVIVSAKIAPSLTLAIFHILGQCACVPHLARYAAIHHPIPHHDHSLPTNLASVYKIEYMKVIAYSKKNINMI